MASIMDTNTESYVVLTDQVILQPKQHYVRKV